MGNVSAQGKQSFEVDLGSELTIHLEMIYRRFDPRRDGVVEI